VTYQACGVSVLVHPLQRLLLINRYYVNESQSKAFYVLIRGTK
jgi:hypothetical protein